MRLFAKFFLCATLVISVALLFSGYLLITISHENAISREVDRALNQYQYDKFTVQAGIITYDNDSGSLPDTLNSLSSDLSGQVAFFAEDQTLLYSNLPVNTDFSILNNAAADAILFRIQTFGNGSFIMVCGKFTQSGMTLHMITASDISAVITQKEQMAQSFVNVYWITLGVSMVLILILSTLLTLPIKRLNRAANKIARGRYNERLPVLSGDEMGELSISFNLMADAVEDKITELLKNARQKEDFVAGFAHELKTPLTSVIGYADMLYQKALSPEQVKDAAWYILSEGMRLEALSLKLMDLIVLNRQDFIMEEMPAGEMLTNIANGLKPLFDERKVSIRLKARPAYVRVEYDLFKTLLINLIDNAMKAGCSHIGLIGQADDGRYTISVFDDGRGIPASDLSRITEAFYMVDKSRSRKQHGAGLGLALAARIAEIHGSTLSFDSKEGVGTVVKIDLACEKSSENG